MIAQVAYACGPGRKELGVSALPEPPFAMLAGEVRRCALWHGGVCALGTTERVERRQLPASSNLTAGLRAGQSW
jgi:hypothetical protein